MADKDNRENYGQTWWEFPWLTPLDNSLLLQLDIAAKFVQVKLSAALNIKIKKIEKRR